MLTKIPPIINVSDRNIENIKDKEHMLTKIPLNINIFGNIINEDFYINIYNDPDRNSKFHLQCCKDMIILDLLYELEKLIRKKIKIKNLILIISLFSVIHIYLL